MGISGLLPYLKSAARPTNIKEFKGCTVAVDSYCWLHKGAFSCADKLVLGEPTEQYVYYCMKYVRNLLSMGIRPIMVFDGCSLPSKKDVEKQRRERREANKKKAADLLREGRRAEARDAFRLCIDITSDMALNLMKACRDIGVDCIVAPYEADAQLAYLNKIGVAQIIITEDSDLLLFGCDRVMFKMDMAGNGVLVEQSCINKALGMKADCYSFEKFRYICILSGCDYWASLPGIGLKKATLIFQRTRQLDMNVVIKKIPTTLNMKTLTVTPAYIEGFFRANNTFLYQLVFDPRKRKLVPLNPYPEGSDQTDFLYAGPYLPAELAYQLALGNVSVYNMEQIYDFDPDNFQPKSRPNYSRDNEGMSYSLSIWDRKYRPPPRIAEYCKSEKTTEVVRGGTLGKEVTVNTPHVKGVHGKTTRVKHKSPVKRQREEEGLSERDLLSLYHSPTSSTHTGSPHQAKRRKSEASLEQSHSTEDSQVLNDLSELLSEAQNGSEIITEGAPDESIHTSMESSKLNDSTDETKKQKGVNRFKVTKDVPRARLDLNMKSGVKVEVTSRYFSASKPTKKATFLDCMQEKDNCTSRKCSVTESEISTSKDHGLDEDQTTEVVADDTREHTTGNNLTEPTSVTKNSSYVTSPYGLFTFKSKLNSFKSDFCSKSSLSISNSTNRFRRSTSKGDIYNSECDRNVKVDTSDPVIDLSSPSDSFSLGNSQTGSVLGSIDQDSFNFTQKTSQGSLESRSQSSEVSITRTKGQQQGSLSFTETESVSPSSSQDWKVDRSPVTNPQFYLGDGASVKEGNEEEEPDMLAENAPQSSQNSSTAGCRGMGLSKSANSTPLTGSSVKKTLSSSCRSSGLKKRISNKSDSENNQTSIKAFFSDNFAYTKGNKNVLGKRKPLSPTKVNIMGPV